MKIEDMTLDSLKTSLLNSTNAEVKKLRYRFICLYGKYFKNNQTAEVLIKSMGEVIPFTRIDLYRKYLLIESELKKRKILFSVTPLDKAVFRRKLKGLGIDTIGDIMVMKEAVCITGEFITNRSLLNKLEVNIRALSEANTEQLLKEINKRIERETKQSPQAVHITKLLTSPYIPLYDLMLVPRALLEVKEPQDEKDPQVIEKYICQFCDSEAVWAYTFNKGKDFIPVCHKCRTKARNEFLGDRSTECIVKHISKVAATSEEFKEDGFEILKPYPNEHAARIKDPSKFDKIRRTKGGIIYGKVKIPSDVSVLWGHIKEGKEKAWEPQSIRFPKDKYSAAEAKKWLKDNKIKYQQFEQASDKKIKAKKLERFQKTRDEITVLFVSNLEYYKNFHRSHPAELYGHIEIPGDVAVIFADSVNYESDEPMAIAMKFPADKYSIDRVKEIIKELSIWAHSIETTSELDDFVKFEIIKVDDEEQIVGGIVYEPNVVDTQGDYTDEEEIKKAMYRFMEKYMANDGKLKVMHKGRAYAFPILENFQPEEDTTKGGKKIKKGAWWLMLKITSKSVWKDIKSGNLTGFSMGGQAKAE